MNKKGFFFVIMAFLLLTYILTSTYVWVRAIEMEENRYSESFRTSSMEMLLAQVTEEKITEFANISARYAFFRLNHHSINYSVIPSEDISVATELDGSELDNIKYAMRELILNGTASDDYFNGDGIEFTKAEKLTYTFVGWQRQLNASLAASGFELEKVEINEDSFIFNQTNYTQFNISFVMSLTIRDLSQNSDTSLIRTYHVSNKIDATGMVDAYIARESLRQLNIDGEDYIVGKKVFLPPYWKEGFSGLCSEDSSRCYYIEKGTQGQGWFYGPLVLTGAADTIGSNHTYSYILVGTYEEIKAIPNYDKFGAYILTNEPDTSGGDCPGDQADTFNALDYQDEGTGTCNKVTIDSETYTDRPFVVNTDFAGESLSDLDETYHGFNPITWPDPGDPSPMVLFTARHSATEVWDNPENKMKNVLFYHIEGLRDFVMCGYYMPYEHSPSFLHRMFDLQAMYDVSAPAYHDWPESEWGLETTAAGRWAGGELVNPEWDLYSRVDVEFFSKIEDGTNGEDVNMIKGMPGCKNAFMCTAVFEDDEEHVGHFRMSDWARWVRDSAYNYRIDTDNSKRDNIGCDNSDMASCEEK